MNRRRISAWLAETHGGLFELLRHFLTQLTSSELISSREHLERLIIGVLTAFPALGFVLPRFYFKKYSFLRHFRPDLYLPAVRADRMFFISISMLVAGFATVLLWQSIFPSRQDYVVLRHLPVRLTDLFLARLASVLLVVGVLIVDANVMISVTFPAVSANGQPLGRYILAHAVATIAAGAFVLFALIAVQGMLMNLLPARWFDAISVFLQAILLLALLVSVPLAIALPNLHLEIAAQPAWLIWLPSSWFLGMYEVVLGSADAYFRSLAWIAVLAIGAAIALSIVSYAVSYGRYTTRATMLIHGRSAPLWPSLSARLRELIFPDASQQAVAGFATATLRRSRQHKLLLIMYLGVAAALALDSASAFGAAHMGRYVTRDHAIEMEAVLSVPYMISMLIIFGMLHVFRVPSEPRANWIFRMADRNSASSFLPPVSKAVVFAALLPVALITPFATAYALGWRTAILHTVFAMMVALIIAEFKMADWDRIPFTCGYIPGRQPFFQTACLATLLFLVLTTIVTGIETLLLRGVGIYVGIAILAAWYARKSSTRRRLWEECFVTFDETPEHYMKLGIAPE